MVAFFGLFVDGTFLAYCAAVSIVLRYFVNNPVSFPAPVCMLAALAIYPDLIILSEIGVPLEVSVEFILTL
jgi:hypothetical protein